MRPRLGMALTVMLAALVGGAHGAAGQDGAVRTIPVERDAYHLRVAPGGSVAALFEDARLVDNVVDPARLPIVLMDLASGAAIAELGGFTDYASDVALSRDGTRLASIHWNGMVGVWDVAADPTLLRAYATGFLGGSRAAYLDDARTLLVQHGGAPQRFALYDTETSGIPASMGVVFPTFAGFRETHLRSAPFDITYAAFAASPDAGTLATATLNDEIALWRIPDGQPETIRPPSERPGGINIRRLAFTADGRSLVWFDAEDGLTHLWDVSSGREATTLPYGSAAFAVSDDGGLLAWAGPTPDDPDATVVRVAQTTGTTDPRDVATIPWRLHPEATVAFLPGGSLAVGGFLASDDGNVIAIVPVD